VIRANERSSAPTRARDIVPHGTTRRPIAAVDFADVVETKFGMLFISIRIDKDAIVGMSDCH
jgi:hypothetical protein